MKEVGGMKGVFRLILTVGLVWLFIGTLVYAVLADDVDIYRSKIEEIKPNGMILFDTSGSMLTILPVSAYDPEVDHSTQLLGQGKEIVFAREKNGGYPTHHRVTYQSGYAKVQLKYVKVTDGTIQSGMPWEEQWSDTDGYFYFDRAAGAFIDAGLYSDGNADHVKIFLPYATYSVDQDSTGDYVTRYDFDYMNWLFYVSRQVDRDELKAMFDDPARRALMTRVLSAKKVIHDLLEQNRPIRWGLAVFDGSDGAQVLRNIPSDVDALQAALENIWVGGSTPLAESMEDMWDYFGDANSLPVDAWCRENYLVVMTDGLPQQDADSLSSYLKQDHDLDHGGGSEENEYPGSGSGYMDDVAWYMFRNDARLDEDGWQNVTTHTIGFTVSNPLLEKTAAGGGGMYQTAYNAIELNEAFQAVVAGILAETSSYTAPVVPISHMEKTTSGSDLYVALFKPSVVGSWRGNIKKYGLDSDGAVIDVNDLPATDSMGLLVENAQSYWSIGPDGGTADTGGVGQMLLARSTARVLYTYLGREKPLNHQMNAFGKGNVDLTKDILGVGSPASRDEIIDYVHGYDAWDEDGDTITDEKRDWLLGSFLHSRPAVIAYDATTRLIFAGSNDGVFHAFLDSDGSEAWGFVPPDLLPRLQELETGGLSYFVDGSPGTVVVDKNLDGKIEKPKGDRAIVVFGERRGGLMYHALDVTEPYSPEYLWSIQKGDPGFEELGQTWSTPETVMLSDGTVALVFGAGYDPASAAGRGVYVVDALTGGLIWRWTVGEDPAMTGSIPSEVSAIDSNENGRVDRLYVGDLAGGMWRFDLSNLDPGNWIGRRIFDCAGRMVFYQPDVLLETDHEILVWGTGDRTNPNRRDVIDRLYMFRDFDDGVVHTDLEMVDMTEDWLNDPSMAADDRQALHLSLESAAGWFMDLPSSGEKILSSAVTVMGKVYVTSFSPTNDELDPCSMSEGLARLYVVNYRTSAAVMDLDGDPDNGYERSTEMGSSIPSAVQIALLEGRLKGFVGVSGGVYQPDMADRVAVVRVYWRQLY